MKNRFPWGRSIAGIVAAVLFAIGIDCCVYWWRMRTECADAAVTVLAAFENAFGSNGTFQAEFNPKYGFTCKEMLLVEHAPADCSREDVTATVDGLSADLVISDGDGNTILQETLTKDWFLPFWARGQTNTCLPAFLFSPVAPGRYQLRLTVHAPAHRLANLSHRVVVRYELCGIEYLAAAFTGAISLFAFIVAAIITLSIMAVTRKKKRHSNQAPDATSEPAPDVTSSAHQG